MQPLPGQNLELVAASLLKTGLLLFCYVLSAFFVVKVLINSSLALHVGYFYREIERRLGVVKLHVIVKT